MIGFGILSFGLYFPLWFLRRRTALNALHSPRQLQLWPFSLAFAIQTVTIVMAFGGLPRLEGTPPGDTLWPLIRLGIGVLMLVQSFFVKDILEHHLSPSAIPRDDQFTSPPVRLSALLTFLLGIFYLQYNINAHVQELGPRAERA